MHATFSGKDVEAIRQVCEGAVSAMGLHPTQGAAFWEAYITYEQALMKIKPSLEQFHRIRKIYHRQLSIPHQSLEQTMSTYSDWLISFNQEFPTLAAAVDTANLQKIEERLSAAYEKALKAREERVPMEELITALPPCPSPGVPSPEHLKAWNQYIDFEIEKSKKTNPIRVQVRTNTAELFQ